MIIEIPELTLQEALKFEQTLQSLSADEEVVFDFSNIYLLL